MKAQIKDRTQLTANCRKLIFTASAFGAKWSAHRMCPEKTTAQPITKASPRSIVKPSLMHSRYMPAAPISTASQTRRPALRPKNSAANTGTSTM